MFFGADLVNLKNLIDSYTLKTQELKNSQSQLEDLLKIQKKEFSFQVHTSFVKLLEANVKQSQQWEDTLAPYDQSGWDLNKWSSYDPKKPVIHCSQALYT